MNTTGQSSAEVKPATTTTAADVVAFLKAKVAESGIAKIHLGCDSGYHKPFVARSEEEDDYFVKFGETPEEAIAAVKANRKTPKQLAEEKYAAAQKLITEADALLDSNSSRKIEVAA